MEQDAQTVEGVMELNPHRDRNEVIREVLEERKRRTQEAPEWGRDEYRKKNTRRLRLISREISQGLSDEESDLLTDLQEKCGAWMDAHTGIPALLLVDIDRIGDNE